LVNFSDFFNLSLDPAQALPASYNYALVVVSYLIASLGSYGFLQFAGLVAESDNRISRFGWLIGGAMAMGCGIWAMHFVGMLARVMPISVSYDTAVTALSAVPAILATGVALHVVARPALSMRRLLIGGTLMGAGIGAMHYTGMAAMRLDALVRYDPLLFATSVIVAVVLAIIALQVRFWIGQARGGHPAFIQEVVGALILGFAVTAMHYTAMASTYCFGVADRAGDSLALTPGVFATVTSLIAALVLLMAMAVIFARRVKAEVAMRERAIDRERSSSEQLVQLQKMEAVGQLTGGVAHDFNNILMVMLAHIEALREDEGVQKTIHPWLDRMAESVQRATDLIRQLLAFSRKQILKPTIAILNDLVSATGGLLRRTLGEQVEIQIVLDPGLLWSTNVDRAQVEAALINLCVNARDATPGGGRLVIETKSVTFDQDYAAQQQDVVAGDYVMLSVTDTGSGMTTETLARVFEPFFATKEVGKGTGLGLSMVYGFIKQSNGHIAIDSEPGHGTTVKLYFRRSEAAASTKISSTNHSLPRGSERILIVEDEESVRALIVAQLRILGYDVSQAGNADDAFVRFQSDSRFDLLLTDVVMPGRLNGKTLADEVERRWPDTRVVFMSGYSENALLYDGRLGDGIKLLSKPFRKADLAKIVRSALANDDHNDSDIEHPASREERSGAAAA
jgi:NO-binding membrane sensor protein with MHYT domain/nitrogen-specific signal transduction histidine kinase/CheY-like chemotaxis protein